MINVEFRAAATENKDEDRWLWRAELLAVPDVGELININGEPWRIIGRSWATGVGNDLWCYIRVR